MKKNFIIAAIAATVALSSCCTESAPQTKTLKGTYEGYFPIGVALGADTYKTDAADSLISMHFSSVTAENCMKPHHIGAVEGKYNFTDADNMVAYAQSKGNLVRGHALLWHQSAPDWFFAPDKDGNEATKELVLERLRTYIHAVVTHFKGKVYCWDVVNEAISDNPKEYLRTQKTRWYEMFGDAEFIEKAFTYAHEADPDALLFYNDYNVIKDSKRANIIKLVKSLQEKGIPIHGVGIQGHWNIIEPTRENLEQTIADIKALGLLVHVTELDVRINPKWVGGQLSAEDAKEAVYVLTDELQDKIAAQYKMIFEVFRENRETLSSVTFWNLYDKISWLDMRQGSIGRSFPLLFDDNMAPKKAYNEVVNF